MPSQQRMKKNNSEELASQAKKCRKIDSFFNKTVVHNQPTTPAIAKLEKTDSKILMSFSFEISLDFVEIIDLLY